MTKATDKIYFHEDDYCQQELLPLSALEFCRKQLNKIDEFSAAHASPDGFGWTDIFMREDPPDKLADLCLTHAAFGAIMGQRLREFPVVYTGYSSHEELCQRTVGYGHNAESIVYADWNNDGIIEHIWIRIFTNNDRYLDDVVASVLKLGQDFPLLYVDWDWSFVIPLDETPVLREHISSKLAEIQRRMKE